MSLREGMRGPGRPWARHNGEGKGTTTERGINRGKEKEKDIRIWVNVFSEVRDAATPRFAKFPGTFRRYKRPGTTLNSISHHPDTTAAMAFKVRDSSPPSSYSKIHGSQ